MNFNPADIKKIAHLACLAITDEQAQVITPKFNKILTLVDTMNESDTTNTESLSHPFDAIQPLRPDIATESNQRQQLLAIAPSQKAGLFVVPQFIETE